MTQVIEEYLVKIGYKSDKAAYKQSVGMVNSIGLSALGAAGKIAQIGVAVTAATTVFAYNMRKMYFTSQLAGSSVENIKAVGFAAKQAGVSSEAMTQAQLNFAKAIRRNPGIPGYLKSLGVKVEGRQMSDVVIDAVDALNKAKMPQGAKENLMESWFGVSGDDFVLLAAGIDKVKEKQGDAKKIFDSMKVDMTEGENVVKHYTEKLDLMGLAFDGLGYKIGIKFVKSFDKGVTKVLDWIDGFAFGIDNFESEWDGFLKRLAKDAKSGALTVLEDLSMGIVKNAEASEIPAFPQTAGKTASPTTSKKRTRAERNNNPGNIEYGPFAMAQGAVGSDGRFAIFPDLETGYRASRNLLSNYGEKGINTVSGVISKWAPPSENNTSAYAGYVAKQMGVGASEQLDMNDPFTLGQLSKYIGQYEGMPPNATVTQTNNFNITGSNAEQIAQEVVTKNDRASADLNRYTKSLYR